MAHRSNDTGKGNRSTRRKTCPSATLSTTNLTQTGLELSPGLSGEKPVTTTSRPIYQWNGGYYCCTQSTVSSKKIIILLPKNIWWWSINIFSEYNQQDETFFQFIYFCKTLHTFQTVFPSTIRSSKLHIQCQAFVRLLLLPADSYHLKRVERLTEINKMEKSLILLVVLWECIYVHWHCMCNFWVPDGGQKNRLKRVEGLTGINKLRQSLILLAVL
jgi:hypothetical protein